MYYSGCFFNPSKISKNTVCACGFSRNNFQILSPLSDPYCSASRIWEAYGILFPVMKTGKCVEQNPMRCFSRKHSCASEPCSIILIVHHPTPHGAGSVLPRVMDSIKKISRFIPPEMVRGNTTLLRIHQQEIPGQKILRET
jgi:hypothetical protein